MKGITEYGVINLNARNKFFARRKAKKRLKQKVKNAKKIKIRKVFDFRDYRPLRYSVTLSYVIPSQDAKKG